MRIKALMNSHFIYAKMAFIGKAKNSKILKDVEKKDTGKLMMRL